MTHYFLEAKISRPFIFRWKWLPFLFLELFFFVGIRWKYGDGWRSRRLGITVTDEKDSDGLLKGCNVLQSNEAPIGVVGMVQKVYFSKVQVVAIFQKGKREGSAFFSWV